MLPALTTMNWFSLNSMTGYGAGTGRRSTRWWVCYVWVCYLWVCCLWGFLIDFLIQKIPIIPADYNKE